MVVGDGVYCRVITPPLSYVGCYGQVLFPRAVLGGLVTNGSGAITASAAFRFVGLLRNTPTPVSKFIDADRDSYSVQIGVFHVMRALSSQLSTLSLYPYTNASEDEVRRLGLGMECVGSCGASDRRMQSP